MNFGRLITAMITPFNAGGQVNYEEAQKLAEYLLNNGSDSLVVSGTTGESPTLSKEEKSRLFAAVKEVTRGRAAMICGASTYNTAESLELSKAARQAGADALLVVAPYYSKPPQEGLYQHFAAIAEAGGLPVILYNIPGRTGINILPQTFAKLAKIPNIVGVKDSTGNMDQISEVRMLAGKDFLIYSGDDSLTLPMLALGGAGVISVAAHLAGKQIKDMIENFFAGNFAAAAEIHIGLFPLFKKLFLTANPIPLKYCLNKLGCQAGPCRLPLFGPEEKVCRELDDLTAGMPKMVL
ncbi:MAG: 4-hydroxy-tetrahydrodipicolinate synthase [Clostridiales bacterium]|nr:4-hydroxy-tetrahydrodipicolinate synthase [Clostridiales bacterium]